MLLVEVRVQALPQPVTVSIRAIVHRPVKLTFANDNFVGTEPIRGDAMVKEGDSSRRVRSVPSRAQLRCGCEKSV